MSGINVFLNAPLSGESERRFNERVLKRLQAIECTRVYAPQRELPVGTPLSSKEIMNANLRAIEECDVVVSVLDKPGLGVALELGVALALNKQIVAFRADSSEYLGRMLEGLWDDLPAGKKAKTIDQLVRRVASLAHAPVMA